MYGILIQAQSFSSPLLAHNSLLAGFKVTQYCTACVYSILLEHLPSIPMFAAQKKNNKKTSIFLQCVSVGFSKTKIVLISLSHMRGHVCQKSIYTVVGCVWFVFNGIQDLVVYLPLSPS